MGCPEERQLRDPRFAAHVRECERCAEKLEVLALLDAPETAEEQQALDALPREPDRLLAAAQLRAGPGALRVGRRNNLVPWIVGAVAAAAAVVVAVMNTPRDPALVLRQLQGASRPLEVAVAELPYAPYQPRRGPAGADFDKPLRQLLEAREKGRPGAARALAMLYLVRAEPGDAARADAALAQATEPEAENERGVLLFARGEFVSALERFLRADARFNAGVTLAALGLRQRAALAFEKVPAGPWSAEAAQRARELRQPSTPPQPSRRLEVMRGLLGASSEAELAKAREAAASMPDLLALAGKLEPRRIARHAELYQLYKQLRDRAVQGSAAPAELDAFAKGAEVQADPLLWSAALELAGYLHAARGEWRAAQPFEAAVAGGCEARGCATEVEAIALDELADLAALDGDFPSARKLQDRAEARFGAVGARDQLAELARKRSALLEEQDQVPQALMAAQAAVQESAAPAALAVALEQAREVATRLDLRLAARELGEAALEQARQANARDLEADLIARLATAGELDDAKQRLAEEIAALEQVGHHAFAARLQARLAGALLAANDAAGALAESERGLSQAGSAWESSRVLLHSTHARALAALGRAPEASVELWLTLDELAKAIAAQREPAPLPEAAQEVVQQLAAAATSADALALPLDRLRAAALGAASAQAGWSHALPEGACVLTLVPHGAEVLQGIATRDGGGVRAVPPAEAASGTEKCAQLWLFADAPLDQVKQITGIATSLSRLLAAEEAGAPKRALIVSAQAGGDAAASAVALPGAADEAAALRAAGAEVTELCGERATPARALELAAGAPLLHFAAHGFGGAFLQLAGEDGRLASREIAQARLLPGARVVLSSCEAGAPGPRGVAWAFAKAGAAAVVAPLDKVDDAAAARWSRQFYAALARGATFTQAAVESRAARFVVVK